MGELTGLKADLAQIVRLALAEQAEDVYLFAARLLRKYRGLSRSWLSDGAGSHCPLAPVHLAIATPAGESAAVSPNNLLLFQLVILVSMLFCGYLVTNANNKSSATSQSATFIGSFEPEHDPLRHAAWWSA
ncbi:MAG: hypothetical protein L7A77_10750 [Xylella fastidiosa subsp. multiplex]|nr:hypothetical protein [Xylella fastidiosa subsp. multiplex]